MSRALSMLFTILCYAIFFATFLYLIVFVGNFTFATLTVDTGPGGATLPAVIVDLILISLFGLQHSIMARQGFKQAWTRVIPPQIERSIYVLAASIMLMILFLFWRPIDSLVWSVTSRPLVELIWLLFGIGWLTVLISTFLINHFELFGLQQTWLHMKDREPEPPKLRQPLFYKWVRHPLYVGFFLAFWAIPQMTVGHLLLALGMSAYMLIAIRYEEQDLVRTFGKDYEQYRSEVGMLTPRFRRRNPARSAPDPAA